MTPDSTDSPLDVCVVMPVYNEEAVVAEVVGSWLDVLGGLGVRHRLLALDDGSSDASGRILEELAARRPALVVVRNPNSGHGPTILQGYRRAVATAEWVLQVDSDGEMPAEAFGWLWENRQGAAAVLGVRTGRRQSPGRWFISAVSRLTVRAAFGSRLADVNSPYRLLRAEALGPLLERIPADTFAPNVALSGMLARSGAPVVEVPVPHRQRTTGNVSIVGLGALRAAVRSFAQTLRLARRTKP